MAKHILQISKTLYLSTSVLEHAFRAWTALCEPPPAPLPLDVPVSDRRIGLTFLSIRSVAFSCRGLEVCVKDFLKFCLQERELNVNKHVNLAVSNFNLNVALVIGQPQIDGES